MYLVTLIKLHGTDDGGKILKERTKITIKIISSYVTQQWGHLGFCFSATFPVQQYAQILTAEAYTKGRGKEAKMLPWKMIAIVRRFVQVMRSGGNSWFMFHVWYEIEWTLKILHFQIIFNDFKLVHETAKCTPIKIPCSLLSQSNHKTRSLKHNFCTWSNVWNSQVPHIFCHLTKHFSISN